MMQKQHVQALKTTRVSGQARQRHNTDDWEEVNGVPPNYDCVLLQEEEESQEVTGKIGFWKNIDLRIPNERDPKYSTVVHTVQSTSTSYV
jgi:hypothetical protein